MRLHLELAGPGAPLRAAAAVRAAAFGSQLPPGRSAWAQAAFIRGKTGDAWTALEAKIAGTDADWAGVRVVCLLASVFEVDGQRAGGEPAGLSSAVVDLPSLPPTVAAALAAATDPSCCLPGPLGSQSRRWALGTLDVNVGPALPSERLRAQPPPGGGALAYLSNVSVASPARRAGVGSALVRHALDVIAPSLGVTRVAVHAATAAADALYARAGFALAGEEGRAAARARCEEPRRLFVIDVR